MVTFKLKIEDINVSHVHFRMWVGHGLRLTHASPVTESICMDREEFSAFAIRLVAYVYIEDHDKFIEEDTQKLLKELRLNIYDHYDPAEGRPWFSTHLPVISKEIKNGRKTKTNSKKS